MDEKIFKQDAKQIVDMAFDKKLFHNDMTRDNMNGFEDLIGFLLSSKFESYKRADAFLKSVKNIKEK